MKSGFFLLLFLLKFSISTGQIEQDGSSCNRAIIISDTSESVQLPSVSGVRWYKFKSSCPFFTLKLFRSGTYIIYESQSNDFCSLSNKENILFAFGDSLTNVDNKYIRYKAAQWSGLCYCDNCLKSNFFKVLRIREDSYYYVQLINTSYPCEIQFDRKSKVTNQNQKRTEKDIKKRVPCEIVFMKSYSTGMISNYDSLKNKPFNSDEWRPLKYGLHIYYLKRDLQERIYKIRSYGLDEVSSKCALDSLVKYLFEHPEKKILISGFVTKGEDKLAEKYELAASEALAKVVRNYLVDRKISMKRIKIEGKGSSIQLYENEKSKLSFMYELNRNNRVEIKVLEENNEMK